VVTFLFAIGTLLAIRFPAPPASSEGKTVPGGFLGEATYGLAFIRARPALVALLCCMAAIHLNFGLAYALFTPLVLTFSSAPVLGTMVTTGGIGMFAGGLLMTTWGGPRRRMYGVLAGAILLGVAMALAGLRQNPIVLTAALFAAFAGLPIAAGCSRTIWQSKVPADVQGRVFSIRNMVVDAAMPMAFLIAGPLADHVFEPLLAADGLLAGSVGAVFGTGPGRGIGLMFTGAGVFLTLSAAGACCWRRLRCLEDALPDAVGDLPLEGQGTCDSRLEDTAASSAGSALLRKK
jgi:hypothetical protein